MPHQCTNCGRTFPDGSKEMLSGCPDCGGHKFQFRPTSAVDDETDGFEAGGAAGTDADPTSPSETSDARSADASPAGGASPGTAPSAGTSPDTEGDGAPGENATGEDRAQRDARSEVVGPDELPKRTGAPDPPDADGTVIEPEDDDRPDIDDLREELNDQFESIRIVSPGTYELNLMELYDRDEYIISLQEDGRYVIEVPESWRAADEE
jgi:hypothetical protein